MTQTAANPMRSPRIITREAVFLEGTTTSQDATTESSAARVAVEIGTQNQLSAELLRADLTTSDGMLHVKYEAGTVMAGAGLENSDGSRGFNAGVSATSLGVEATFEGDDGGSSFTVGAAAGLGAAFSIGVRDQDKDGGLEGCIRATVGPFTLGACVERPKLTGFSLRR